MEHGGGAARARCRLATERRAQRGAEIREAEGQALSIAPVHAADATTLAQVGTRGKGRAIPGGPQAGDAHSRIASSKPGAALTSSRDAASSSQKAWNWQVSSRPDSSTIGSTGASDAMRSGMRYVQSRKSVSGSCISALTRTRATTAGLAFSGKNW